MHGKTLCWKKLMSISIGKLDNVINLLWRRCMSLPGKEWLTKIPNEHQIIFHILV
jgi:hypothetical protein